LKEDLVSEPAEEATGNDMQDRVLGLLAGIAVGVMVGAAAALLTAPQSGQETRHQIRESAEDALTGIKSSIDELRAKLDEVRSAVRRRGPEAGEPGEETAPAG
jgi:gas vesicle protein